ncbi:MAG: CHASE2 domain-containing protein, partial [Pseudomonadota bacterium]
MNFRQIFVRLKEKDFDWQKGPDISQYYPLLFTILFVIILFQYSFTTLEAVFYDLRIRYDWGISSPNRIVFITMDEESDEFLGEKYPYTSAGHERLMRKLLKEKPKIINYFVNLSEPETENDVANLHSFKDQIKQFTASGGAFRIGTDLDAWGEQLPPKELRDLGYSLALINIDNLAFSRDDVSRRALLNISGEDTLHLWTANQFRQSTGKKSLTVADVAGAYYLREADATYFLYRYYTSPIENNSKFKKIPFHRVVVGNFPPGFFTDKIVLIGPTYVSNTSDYVLTPFNRENYRAPKLFVHSQIIEALIQNKSVNAVPQIITYILCALMAIFLSLIISRVRPTKGLLITVGMMGGTMLVSYLLFVFFGLWLYVTHIILTIFVVYYIWVPFRAIIEYQSRFAIQEEAKMLRKLEDLKQNFISLMSHDLKTPIAKIAGMADVLLQKHNQDGDLSRNLHSIVDTTKELNKFITSILDLTKVESQKFNLQLSSKDINPLIESCIAELHDEIADKQMAIEANLSPLYPIQIDPTLMKRVISNLVENAIKYAGPGKKISIKSWEDGPLVYIEVRDNGMGISKEHLE